MSMIETAAPGLHDAILLCASVSAVYLVVVLLQLAQLKRHRRSTGHPQEPSLGMQLMTDKGQTEVTMNINQEQSFASQLRRTNLEADLHRLQNEVESLRHSLSLMQQEIKSLQPKRDNTTATLGYNDAMALASRGLSAEGIASRCGISMGEAELVTALARTQKSQALVVDAGSSANEEENVRHHEYQHSRAA